MQKGINHVIIIITKYFRTPSQIGRINGKNLQIEIFPK